MLKLKLNPKVPELLCCSANSFTDIDCSAHLKAPKSLGYQACCQILRSELVAGQVDRHFLCPVLGIPFGRFCNKLTQHQIPRTTSIIFFLRLLRLCIELSKCRLGAELPGSKPLTPSMRKNELAYSNPSISRSLRGKSRRSTSAWNPAESGDPPHPNHPVQKCAV